MKTLVQPAGYAITVTSWENDADNYNTKTCTVATKQEAQTLYSLAMLLQSRNQQARCFGNMYEPNEYELQQFAQAVAAIPGIKEYIHNVAPDIEDPECGADYMDVVTDTLYDLGLSSGEFFTRVAETVTVYYYAEPIYAEDVTYTFI
jgi:tRNA A37 methylthiotransferase MiaB